MRPLQHLVRSLRAQRNDCSSSRRCFQDETLRWAALNKDKARVALALPPPRSIIPPMTTLEDYLNQRGWVPAIEDSMHDVALISHVLSAPLTLQYHLEQQQQLHQTYSTTNPSLPENLNICCIGARAEATLPTEYWKELLMKASRRQWRVDFVGPDLVSNTPPIELKHNNSLITMQVHFKGYFHDMPLKLRKSWDHFLILNPGLGHYNLKANWLPTIKALKGQSILLTAHSELDAERDTMMLREEMGMKVHYRPNPFASRISYQDPLDKEHFLSPNKYMAYVKRTETSEPS